MKPKRQIKAYLAGPISGLRADVIVTRSLEGQQAARTYGIIPLDPVEEEGVLPRNRIVQASLPQLKAFWKRDKEMLAEADCLINLDANKKSDGVYMEIGIMKYKYKKPVVLVYPVGIPKACISSLEVDYVTDEVETGMAWIRNHFKRGR